MVDNMKKKYKAVSNKFVFYENSIECLINRIKQTDKRLKYVIIQTDKKGAKKTGVVYRKNITIFVV